MNLDTNSLAVFIKQSETSREIDRDVASAAKVPVVFSDDFVRLFVARLQHVGINHLQEVEKMLQDKKSFLISFANAWLRSPGSVKSQLVPAGIGLSFLAWTLEIEKKDHASFVNFLKMHSFNKNRDAALLATQLEEAYRSAIV